MPEIVVHELYNIIIIEENIGLTVYALHSRPIIVFKNSLLPEIYGKKARICALVLVHWGRVLVIRCCSASDYSFNVYFGTNGRNIHM